jgi:hypothetical protein
MTDDGLRDLQARMAQLQATLGPAVAAAAYKGGRLVQSTVIKSIKTQSMGETVTRIKPGQAPYEHVASNPGDAPNTDTGELIRGIQIEVTGADVFVGVESSQDEKALALEFGKLDGSLEARPFLFPALEVNRKRIRDMVSDALAEQVAGANNAK